LLLNDTEITELAAAGMINPFVPEKIREIITWPASLAKKVYTGEEIGWIDATEFNNETRVKALSYGLGHFGYDIRLSSKEFKIFRHIPGTVINPKAFNPQNLVDAELHHDEYGAYFIIPGHSYGLGVAIERLKLPDYVTALAIGKSTYARLGLIANLTPAEAGWEGHLTLEFSNASPADIRVYANEGVVQLLFFTGNPCKIGYGDGKYQGQEETIVFAKV
jgi:dCTP deaminase